MQATQSTDVLGKLITSYDGKVRGPKFGEVYTMPAGEHGYISGYRTQASPGLGLIGREWHATQKAAQDRAVAISDN